MGNEEKNSAGVTKEQIAELLNQFGFEVNNEEAQVTAQRYATYENTIISIFFQYKDGIAECEVAASKASSNGIGWVKSAFCGMQVDSIEQLFSLFVSNVYLKGFNNAIAGLGIVSDRLEQDAPIADANNNPLPIHVFNANKNRIFEQVYQSKNNDLYSQIEAFLFLQGFTMRFKSQSLATMQYFVNEEEHFNFVFTGIASKSNIVHADAFFFNPKANMGVKVILSPTTFDNLDSFATFFFANEYLSRLKPI